MISSVCMLREPLQSTASPGRTCVFRYAAASAFDANHTPDGPKPSTMYFASGPTPTTQSTPHSAANAPVERCPCTA